MLEPSGAKFPFLDPPPSFVTRLGRIADIFCICVFYGPTVSLPLEQSWPLLSVGSSYGICMFSACFPPVLLFGVRKSSPSPSQIPQLDPDKQYQHTTDSFVWYFWFSCPSQSSDHLQNKKNIIRGSIFQIYYYYFYLLSIIYYLLSIIYYLLSIIMYQSRQCRER